MRMMAKKVTQEDIAKETGLSKYAVSRAIAGKSGTSDATRERVLDACKRLGYVRSQHTAGANQYIVLMIPKFDLIDPAFWMKVVQGVESAATKGGYVLHVKILRGDDDPLAAQDLENATGVIFAGYRSVDYACKYKGKRPSVLMTYPPQDMFQMDCLYCADVESSGTLCQKLLDWGHRDFVYCGDGSRPSAKHRLDGVKQKLAQHGLVLMEQLRTDDLQDRQALMQHWREQKENGTFPSAILCENDTIVNLVMRVTGLLQLRVPEDVSIVTFNNDPRDLGAVAVTGMGLDKSGFGKEAVHMLLDRIERESMPFKRIAVMHQYYDNHTAGPCR